jgi:SAM-dependent methyltransferase
VIAIQRMKQWYHRQTFDPSIGGAFVNPFFLARRELIRSMRRIAYRVRGRVLDVGCGQKPYSKLFAADAYVGLEIDTPMSRAIGQADYYYDGLTFPFADHEFDTVLCSQVLEHVFEPDTFLSELHRILKPGGMLIVTVPFVWDEHEQPYDYARYSSFGLRHLFTKHGFVIEEQFKTLGNVLVLCQLLNAYLYKVTRSRSRLVNLIVTAVLMAPVSLLGLLLAKVLPENRDLYLDNVLAARTLSTAPMDVAR